MAFVSWQPEAAIIDNLNVIMFAADGIAAQMLQNVFGILGREWCTGGISDQPVGE
jgi:hypothetical protein